MTGKKKTALIIGIIAVVLIAAGVLVWILRSNRTTSASGGVYVQSVSEVNSAGSGIANRYSGVVETQKTEKVEFDTSKTQKELFVQEGQRVAKGDALFSYDTESIELQIQQAQLEMERMNTTISNDNAQITQLQKDMKSASSSEKPSYSAQIQDLQAEIAQTEYNLKSKQAEVDKLNVSITESTVTAGMDGTIDSIADLDQLLSGNSYNSDGTQNTTYIEILADGDLRIKGRISEQTISGIYQDMAVIVRSRVDESQYWTGTISSIDTQSSADSDNVYYYSSGESASKYSFYVNLDSIDGLMLGQHVTIEADYGQTQAKDGIWLNSGWIVQEDDGAYVWAAKSGGAKLEKRSVELGEYDSDMDEYQIVSGLAVSDYLAWPDVDCVAGAATTTEYVIDEDMMDVTDDYYDDISTEDAEADMPDGEAEGLDDSFTADAQEDAASVSAEG